MKTVLGLVCCCLLSTLPAWADPVIGFDDVTSVAAVPVGYRGLNWDGFVALDGVHFPGNPSGFQAGVISGDNVAVNINGTTASIAGEMFDLISANLTAGYNDNLQVEAKGFIHGTLVYDNVYILGAKGPTLVTFNYFGVDKVDFTSFGGTHHAGYVGSGTYFAMDDVTVALYVPYSLLVTNGGFETGDLTGWRISGNTNEESVVTNAADAHAGVYGLKSGPVGTLGFLSQTTLPTTAGQSYLLSFWLNASGSTPNEFLAAWNQGTLFDQTNVPALGWTNLQYTVTATKPRTFLEFGFRNDPSFFGFDEVSVTPIRVVKNGGFEAGDFSNWTQSGNTSLTTVSSLAHRAGTYGAQFGPSGTPGFISQNLATYPGQPYLISCWLKSDGSTPNRFLATWNGQTLIDQTNLGNFGWTNLHFIATATGPESILSFGLRDDASYLYLDEISVIPVPIVTNGGFETGDLDGWTSSGVPGVRLSTNGLYTSSGFYGVELGPFGGLGYLSQTVATLPGQLYLLSFWFDTPDGLNPNDFGVSWNGSQLLNITNWFASGWFNMQFLVTADSTNSEIQFAFRDDPSYLGLDEVTLQPAVVPEFISVHDAAGTLTFTWSTMAGFVYQIQSSPDLITWSNFGPAKFSVGDTLTATDSVGPGPHRFYRIVLLQPSFLF